MSLQLTTVWPTHHWQIPVGLNWLDSAGLGLAVLRCAGPCSHQLLPADAPGWPVGPWQDESEGPGGTGAGSRGQGGGHPGWAGVLVLLSCVLSHMWPHQTRQTIVTSREDTVPPYLPDLS